MNLITMDYVYLLIGAILVYVVVRIAMDKRHPARLGSIVFWGILALIFLIGKFIPPTIVGYSLLIMAIIAAAGKVKGHSSDSDHSEERKQHARRLGGKIFIPALTIPAFTVIFSLTLGKVHFGHFNLVDKSSIALIALTLATIIAFVAGKMMTKSTFTTPLSEGGRLIQSVGWAIMLPPMFSALGVIFNKAGVGEVISHIVKGLLPTDIPFVAVAAYCIGMALFTMIMGGAFAAFAVITGGIGLPLIVQAHGGDAAIMGAIGMYAGYCGTLMTPMAASFNIVPAILLDLKDQNAVVKTQIPIGIPLLAANILLMYFLVYHF